MKYTYVYTLSWGHHTSDHKRFSSLAKQDRHNRYHKAAGDIFWYTRAFHTASFYHKSCCILYLVIHKKCSGESRGLQHILLRWERNKADSLQSDSCEKMSGRRADEPSKVTDRKGVVYRMVGEEGSKFCRKHKLGQQKWFPGRGGSDRCDIVIRKNADRTSTFCHTASHTNVGPTHLRENW